MHKVGKRWLGTLPKRAAPLVLLLQVPFTPSRAFRKIRQKGYVRLGILVYLTSALLGVYVIYTNRRALDEILPWIYFFRPVQGSVLSLLNHLGGLALPEWYHYALLFLIDIAVVSALVSVVPVAARAMLEIEIATHRLRTAVFLVLGVIGLLAWPLFSIDAVSDFLKRGSELRLYLAGFIWLGFFVYFTVALVAINDLSASRSLWLLALSVFFLPIWVVGVIISLFPFLSSEPKRPDQVPLASGIILKPGATFELIKQRKPLRNALGMYVLIIIGTLVGSRVSFFCRSETPPTMLFYYTLLFNKAYLVLSWFALEFDYDKVQLALDTGIGLGLAWYVYPYLAIAAAATRVVFTAAVHSAIKRLMRAVGCFQDLLSSFLYIVNAATLYLSSYAFLVWAHIGMSNAGTEFHRFLGPRDSYDYLGPYNYGEMAGDYIFGDYITVYVLWIYVSVFIWSLVLHILAIQRVYGLSGDRALGAWFASVVLFVPVTVVTLLAQAAVEVARPYRVQRLADQLKRLRQEVLDAVKEGWEDVALSKMGELLSQYGEESDITRRARGEVDIIGPLRALFEVVPKPTLTCLIEMGGHRDEDIQVEASQALKVMLDAAPEQVVPSYCFLMSHDCPPGLLRRLRDLPNPTPATELAGLLHTLLTEVNEANLSKQLARAEGLLADWRDRPHGEELYLVYRALHTLSRAATVVDLERAQVELVAVLDIREPLLTETAQVFEPLLDISNYLAYYGRADFENKVPYLSAPLVILLEEQRGLEKKHFPPEDGLLRLLVPHLQDIIMREFDGLRGRADLYFELKPKRAPFDERVSIVLNVRNQGNAAAEQLRVQLEAENGRGFTVADKRIDEVDLLSPKREARLEFDIHPLETGRIRIPFRVSYDDLEKKGRNIPFADVIELHEPGQEVVEALRRETFTNPYIAGLPVKDPAMFFGREDVFRFIRDHLHGRHEKNIIVLRGQRRTGKTSILYQLEHRLDEKFIPVLLDLQGFASKGVDRFLYWIARSIGRAVTERGFGLPMPEQGEFREDPYGYFQQVFLPRALAAIDYHHLLLAFDEFEELAARVEEGKVDQDIFPYLRNLMQHTDQLDFIFAGTHRMQQITHEYWAILFNIALFQDIGFMGPEDVAQIIREPVKGVILYDDLAVEKITRVTAGHPYFVQLLGNKLVDYYLERGKFYLTLQDVNRVLDDVIMGGALQFDYLWGQSSLAEQMLLAAMARLIGRESGTTTLADVTGLLDRFDLALERSDILTVVRSLMTRELISADADFREYQFKFDLMRLWLERYQRFGVVAEVYREHRSDHHSSVAQSISGGTS